MTVKTLSIAEYARHRNVSHTAVRKAIQTGRLLQSVTTADGKQHINPQIADREWETNTRPRIVPTERQADGAGAIIKSRAIHEAYRARLKKLEYEERIGQLVDAETQYREGFEQGRRIRNTLMAMVDRLAPLLAPAMEEREVKATLLREVTETLRGLAGVSGPDVIPTNPTAD